MTLDKNVENELAHARELAEMGSATIMNFSLKSAQGYAQKIGQDISKQVAEIRALVKR